MGPSLSGRRIGVFLQTVSKLDRGLLCEVGSSVAKRLSFRTRGRGDNFTSRKWLGGAKEREGWLGTGI